MKRLLIPIATVIAGGIIYASSSSHVETYKPEMVSDSCVNADFDTVVSDDVAYPDSNLAQFKSVLDTLSSTDKDGYPKENYYFLYDITKDGYTELWISSGTCEANTELWCYTIENGQVRKILNSWGGHSSYYEFEGKLRCEVGNGPYSCIYTYEYKNGKVRVKKTGEYTCISKNGPQTKNKEVRRILQYFDANDDADIIDLNEIPNVK